ncbi:MAG: hdeD, partial [Bryobacterales bacterium]|nr:hdeD [Bryobacterales bacterium]
MSVVLAKNWWSLVIRGSAAILLGVITVVWPGLRLGRLVLVFFGYALVDGLVSLAGAVRAAEEHERWGSL